MKTIYLITGGSRSGKSSYALKLANQYAGKRIFIATAIPFDDEMKERIKKHKEERNGFITIEEPIDLKKAIKSIPEDTDVAIIDCLTVWIGNLMHCRKENKNWHQEIDDFLCMLGSPPCNMIIVSNEVGMGIVPENRLARKFRDIAGILNQKTAQRAQNVILMISGIGIYIKGGDKDGRARVRTK